MEGKGNSMGARLAGMRPEFGPFGKHVNKPGMNALQVLEMTTREGWDFLYVAGANPALQFPSRLWSDACSKLGFLVVQDLFLTKTAKQADVVLPTLTFIEKGGASSILKDVYKRFFRVKKFLRIFMPTVKFLWNWPNG